MYEEFSKVYTLDDDGFEGSFFGYYVTTDKENLQNWLRNNIDDDGTVVNAIRELTDDIFILRNLNIDDDFQGQGHGKQLLEEIMEQANAPVLLLSDIGEMQRPYFKLETFYERQGFETILYDQNYPLMATEDIALDLKDKLNHYQDKLYVKYRLKANSVDDINFNTKKESLNQFRDFIDSEKDIMTEEDRERIDTIKDLIETGEKIWPIYVKNDNSNDVMEGYHRLIAFDELELETIDVCRPELKKPAPTRRLKP